MNKKLKTRTAILKAAKTLFEEKGILYVTIENIAVRAKICRSTYFTHFTSLDEMFSELIEQELNDLFASVKDGDIKSLIDKLVDHCVEYPRVFVELMTRALLYGENNHAYIKVSDKIAEFVKGRNDIFSSDEMADIILGAYFGALFRKLARRDDKIDAAEFKYNMYKVMEFLMA